MGPPQARITAQMPTLAAITVSSALVARATPEVVSPRNRSAVLLTSGTPGTRSKIEAATQTPGPARARAVALAKAATAAADRSLPRRVGLSLWRRA